MWNGGTACVAPTTTPPTHTPTTIAPAETSVPAQPVGAAAPANTLPTTGASPLPKIGIGALLLAVGTGLVLLGRRRRATR